MADAPVVHIGENSPEEVAHKLMIKILIAEEKKPLTRDYVLDLYAECLYAARGHRDWKKK